jgi:hypothetical protein
VHSNVQIIASVAEGGKSLLQHSQLGRNSSMLSLLLNSSASVSQLSASRRMSTEPPLNFNSRWDIAHTEHEPTSDAQSQRNCGEATRRLAEGFEGPSSWVQTPTRIRKLGGALFCDRRYDTVFVYHNGAESYYAARGFRCFLRV